MDFGLPCNHTRRARGDSFRLRHSYFLAVATKKKLLSFMILALSSFVCLTRSHAQEETKASANIAAHGQSDEQPSVISRSLHGIQLDFVPPLDNSYFRIGVDYCSDSYPPQSEALNKRKWGAGLRFSRFTDSRDDKDLSVALGGYAAQPIANASSLSLVVKLGMDVDYVWRRDDDDRYVNAFMLSAYPALSLETIRSARTGLVISAGYRFNVLSEWQRPGNWADESLGEESEATPGVWSGEAPSIDVSDVFLMIGLKLFIF